MANAWYGEGLKACLDGTIDVDTDTVKIMLVDTSYTYDADHQYIDNGADDSTDPSYNEISATNYTGGYGGAGRKDATVTLSYDSTNDRVALIIGDLTWTTLGNGSNDTVAGAILVKEVTDDTASLLIAYFDPSNVTTNGSNYTLDFSATGNLFINV